LLKIGPTSSHYEWNKKNPKKNPKSP
jgi:hypothetical protein